MTDSSANKRPPKPKSRNKLLRYLVTIPLSLIALFFLLLSLALFFLSSTESGSALLLNKVSDTFADLKIEGVEGRLLSDLNIQHIFWEKDGLEIDVTGAELTALDLIPSVSLDTLHAKHITISLPENEEKKQYKPFEITLPDLHLPIDIDLKNVDVDELHIKQGDALVQLRNVKLSTNIINDTLKLHNLSGNLYDDAGEVIVKAKGEMGLSTPHPLDLEVAIKGNSTRIGVGELDISAKGKVVDYQLLSKGHWKYAEYPEYSLTLLGDGNLEQLDVASLHLDGTAGVADLKGRMSWSPELNWQLTLTGDGLNPAPFVADYSGDLAMEWLTTGSLTDKLTIQLELKKLTGQLQDYPIDASLQMTIKDEVFSLSTLQASVGDNTLMADGKGQADSKNNISINWQLDAPKLAQLHPSVNGKLKADGKLTGKMDGSELSILFNSLTGKVLNYPINAKGRVQLNGQLISAEDLVVNVGRNQLTLNGSADEQQGIDWKLNARNLSQLHPDITGNIKASGNAKGLLDGTRAAL
ncbi:MAG TPA: hypothetical protein ENI84_02995, partial [Thiothrix sp.]|nr:hypothetical protein [Thiothrix sp.]